MKCAINFIWTHWVTESTADCERIPLATVTSNKKMDAAALAAVARRRLCASSLRNKAEHLSLGALPWFDIIGPHLVSSRTGVTYQHGGRVAVATAIISKNYKVPAEYYTYTSYDAIIEDFLRFEEATLRNRLLLDGRIVYGGDVEKAKQLRKFFKDLGKPNVIVLPDNEVIDVKDSSFRMVVRTDLSIKVFHDASTNSLTYILWEDVGFMYRLEKNYDSYF